MHLLHRWRSWSEPTTEMVTDYDGKVFRRKTQQRSCYECNKAQVREIERELVLTPKTKPQDLV